MICQWANYIGDCETCFAKDILGQQDRNRTWKWMQNFYCKIIQKKFEWRQQISSTQKMNYGSEYQYW